MISSGIPEGSLELRPPEQHFRRTFGLNVLRNFPEDFFSRSLPELPELLVAGHHEEDLSPKPNAGGLLSCKLL